MREKLIQYVNLLFAGTPDDGDMKEEILQNTLDRYDDLINQGKSPEAAYRLAIAGIGDIDEILGKAPAAPEPTYSTYKSPKQEAQSSDANEKKLMRAVAIAFYILSPVPVIILDEFGMDTIGVCLMFFLIAAATMLIILGKKDSNNSQEHREHKQNVSPLNDSINRLLGALSLAVYLILSFVTKAWYITWIVFPLFGCIRGLVKAILDLKEAQYEN